MCVYKGVWGRVGNNVLVAGVQKSLHGPEKSMSVDKGKLEDDGE